MSSSVGGTLWDGGGGGVFVGLLFVPTRLPPLSDASENKACEFLLICVPDCWTETG